jgi:hypothetical protein
VGARVLGHYHEPGRTGARLSRARRMLAVQEVVEAGLVRRVRRGAGVTELFEVEDAGGP